MNFRERLEQSRSIKSNSPANDNAGRGNHVAQSGGTANLEQNPDANSPEENSDSEFFGIAHTRNPLACIDLRFQDGNRKALQYSYIMEINFNPTSGIEIITTSKKITITGRDLSRLYDYIIAFRIRFIQEAIGTDISDSGLYVKTIKVEEF